MPDFYPNINYPTGSNHVYTPPSSKFDPTPSFCNKEKSNPLRLAAQGRQALIRHTKNPKEDAALREASRLLTQAHIKLTDFDDYTDFPSVNKVIFWRRVAKAAHNSKMGLPVDEGSRPFEIQGKNLHFLQLPKTK